MTAFSAYGDWLKSERECPHCRRDMKLVKSASWVNGFRGTEKDVYRCDKCGVDVETRHVAEALGFVAKGVSKLLHFVNWDS
jgi:hypothetical protein